MIITLLLHLLRASYDKIFLIILYIVYLNLTNTDKKSQFVTKRINEIYLDTRARTTSAADSKNIRLVYDLVAVLSPADGEPDKV